MIFVTSDIHGAFDKYSAMLKKLSLKPTDALFVLGDVIDKGSDGIKILKDMMYQSNIFPILGEHEYMAKKLLPFLINAASLEACPALIPDDKKEFFASWIKSGGYPTIKAFLALSAEDKEAVLDYLEEFVPFETVEAGGRNFVLVHAGIDSFDEEKELDDYEEEAFVFKKADYSKIYFKNSFLVTGHTFTGNIDSEKKGKVFSGKKHIAINCSENGDKLAVLCLDTFKAYYF
ncbi:MAG: metallophosphoesterase [Clostridia bacterium]|nr:metallophosphoesterase [Clostridia bacterium]MBQ8029884.1 metallophosphoesterase [Clostridia bacterium]